MHYEQTVTTVHEPGTQGRWPRYISSVRSVIELQGEKEAVWVSMHWKGLLDPVTCNVAWA
jgi:hypothetical protein